MWYLAKAIIVQITGIKKEMTISLHMNIMNVLK